MSICWFHSSCLDTDQGSEVGATYAHTESRPDGTRQLWASRCILRLTRDRDASPGRHSASHPAQTAGRVSPRHGSGSAGSMWLAGEAAATQPRAPAGIPAAGSAPLPQACCRACCKPARNQRHRPICESQRHSVARCAVHHGIVTSPASPPGIPGIPSAAAFPAAGGSSSRDSVWAAATRSSQC